MAKLDLIDDMAIEVGADYEASVQLCNAPDLLQYTGVCQIKMSADGLLLLTPTVEVISKDIFKIKIPYSLVPSDLKAGKYEYDVLFSKADDRFYAVGGKIQVIRRITVLL